MILRTEDDQGSLCPVARTSLSSCNEGSWLFSRQPVTALSSLSPWKPAGCSVMWPPRNSQLRARCGYPRRRRPRHGDTRGVNPPGVRDPATVSLPGRRVPSEPSSDLGAPRARRSGAAWPGGQWCAWCAWCPQTWRQRQQLRALPTRVSPRRWLGPG